MAGKIPEKPAAAAMKLVHEISLNLVHSAGSLPIVLQTSAWCVLGLDLHQDQVSISKLARVIHRRRGFCFKVKAAEFKSPVWARTHPSTIAVRLMFGHRSEDKQTHSRHLSVGHRNCKENNASWCLLRPGAELNMDIYSSLRTS